MTASEPRELADRLERETAGMTPGPWRYPVGGEIASDHFTVFSGEVAPNDAAGIVALRNARDDILRALRAVPAALDIERLADALHGWKQCDFGYCEGREDHISDAQGIAAEYAVLAPSAGSSGTRMLHDSLAAIEWIDGTGAADPSPGWCPVCRSMEPRHSGACSLRAALDALGESAEQPSHPAAPSIGEAE